MQLLAYVLNTRYHFELYRKLNFIAERGAHDVFKLIYSGSCLQGDYYHSRIPSTVMQKRALAMSSWLYSVRVVKRDVLWSPKVLKEKAYHTSPKHSTPY
jgi:hypothetical protein